MGTVAAHMVSMNTSPALDALAMADIIAGSLAPLDLPADVLAERVAHLVRQLFAAGYAKQFVAALPSFVEGHQLGRITPNTEVPDADGYLGPHQMVNNLSEAQVVTSDSCKLGTDGTGWLRIEEKMHRPLLDIDFPAALIPSSTPGHFHLYLDKPMTWHKYSGLLNALGTAGILEPGYVGVSQQRQYTALRLPWVKKAFHGEEAAAIDNGPFSKAPAAPRLAG